MKKGKKYIESAKLIDKTKLYDTEEALKSALNELLTEFVKPE